jgi:hypothetical protein
LRIAKGGSHKTEDGRPNTEGGRRKAEVADKIICLGLIYPVFVLCDSGLVFGLQASVLIIFTKVFN